MSDSVKNNCEFADLLGIKVLKKEDGQASLVLPLREELTNPYGMMHGGALSSLADSAMASAMHSRFPGRTFFTTQLEITFKAPMKSQEVIAEAKIYDQRLNMHFTEVMMTDNEGELIAQATAAFFLAGEKE